ncbi:hypothetical protein [Aeromonas veronii]|uniref:hypothetical protein n=1 Tax=Aeromonas veronii TaxID=654 RepID=UPI003D23811B
MDKKLPVASLLSLTIAALLGGCGGSDSADKTTDPVTPPTTKSLDVRAVDGYLKDAQVWLDINGDYAFTAGEPNATTDGTGKATLVVTKIDHPEQYRVLVQAIAKQTTDVGDGTGGTSKLVTKTFTMAAPAGISTVTPLTTLVAQQMTANSGMTQEQAAQEVATQLGLGADKAGELLKDFIADKNSIGQVYALNIVAALPEELDDDTADDLLTQGAAIGKALDDYLAQNPLDDDTQPDDIKVVIGDDGKVDDVIKDSDGDGKDDDDIPPVPSDTLASFFLSTSDIYMAGGGDSGDAELWTDHWQSQGSGILGWKESNILIGKTQYSVDTSMGDVSYRLGDSGWTEVRDSDDIHMVGNSDGSVSLTDSSHAGKLTGNCQDVGGKTLASVVGSSTQVVDSSATFTAGAVGCAVHFSDTATNANYRIDNWTHGENAVDVNGVKASTLADLFSSSAPVAEGPNAIATVFDKPIDTWSESYGNVRLVLVRSAANATSGVAQLWQYNANVQGYQLLSDVTTENHQGWTLQTLHGVTLLTFSDAIEQYLNHGDDYTRVGLTEWQGRVQWVDNSAGGDDGTMLFMNKVAYDDLMKGRTLVTGSDDDNGDGETTPAGAFADFITSGQASYSLYQEGDVLGITQLGGSTYQTYELDYATEPLQVASVADNGTITITRDGSNTVTFTTSQGSSRSVGTEVRDLNGTLVKGLLASVTQSANVAAMQAAFGTATFGSGAKAYMTTHTDEAGQSVGIVLNQIAYEQFLTAVEEANNSDPGTVTDPDAATAFAELITSKATVYSLYGEQGNLGITKVTNANQFMPYVFDYSSNQLLVDEEHLGTGELVVNDDDSVSLMVANEQGVLEQDGVIRCTQVLALDATLIKTLLAQVTDPAQKTAMEAKFATATFSAGAKAYINQHTDSEGSSTEIVLNDVAYQDLLAIIGNPA